MPTNTKTLRDRTYRYRTQDWGRGGGRKGGRERRESDIVRCVSKSLVPRRWVLRGGVIGATAASFAMLGAGGAAAAGGDSGGGR